MKYFATIVLALISVVATGQKLSFAYDQKSSFTISADGVSADSEVFRKQFPNIAAKVTHALSGSTAFVSWDKLDVEDRDAILKQVAQTTQTWKCRYHPKRDRTYITILRDDPDVASVFKKFGIRYRKTSTKLQIRYKEGKVLNPGNEYTGFASIVSRPAWVEYEDEALLKGSITAPDGTLRHVIFDAKLDRKIVPGQIFVNNKYGARELQAPGYTMTLISVSGTTQK